MSTTTHHPNLTGPVIISAQTFKDNALLTQNVLSLVNAAFFRSKQQDLQKWNNETLRFPSTQALLDMLGERGCMAVVCDRDVPFPSVEKTADGSEDRNGDDARASNGVARGAGEGECELYGKKIVACAAVVPWRGGWRAEGAGTEEGWEMKIVCVDGDAKYLRKGLAVQVMGALEDMLVGEERARLEAKGGNGGVVMGEKEGSVMLWILAAECINGVYWRRKGYEMVRKRWEEQGTWSCRTRFEMVVLKKEVRFRV